MSPKVSRKTQPQAGAPEAQPQEAQAQGGGSEPQPQPQPQAGAPESPAPPLQPQGAEASKIEPQPGPSSGFPLLPQQGFPTVVFPPQPGSSGAPLPRQPSPSSASPEEAQPAAGALAAQTLQQLEAEAASSKPPFSVGDQVLSLHGSLLYKAKCLRVAEAACGTAAEAEAGSLTYLIHYAGWNKNWDEWVPASRVFEYSEANLRRQSELLAAHQAQLPPAKKGRGVLRARKTPGLQQRGAGRPSPAPEALGAGEGPSTSQGPQPGPAARRKRARTEAAAEARAAARIHPEVKVEIPQELKPWLVDDWDLVTKQKQLFLLPARKSVDAILQEYEAARTAPGTPPDKALAVVEVVAGIKEYFNVMLGTQLLYKFEQPQYAELLVAHPDVPVSQMYGAPHLLRLFVRIGGMLAYTPLEERSLALLLSHLHDFLGYLAENGAALFSADDYGVAPPEYHEPAE